MQGNGRFPEWSSAPEPPTDPTVKGALSAYNLVIHRYEAEWSNRTPPDDVATAMRVLRRDRAQIKPPAAMWKKVSKIAPDIWLRARSDFYGSRDKPPGKAGRRNDDATRKDPPVRFVALALRRLGYSKATAIGVDVKLWKWRTPRGWPSLRPPRRGSPCTTTPQPETNCIPSRDGLIGTDARTETSRRSCT
jgi:hypothetical protein